jgi:hypothetical protein
MIYLSKIPCLVVEECAGILGVLAQELLQK